MLFIRLSVFWFLALLLSWSVSFCAVPFFLLYVLFQNKLAASFRIYLRNDDKMVVMRIYFDIMCDNAKHILNIRFESISVFYYFLLLLLELQLLLLSSTILYIFGVFVYVLHMNLRRQSEWMREGEIGNATTLTLNERTIQFWWLTKWLPPGSIPHTLNVRMLQSMDKRINWNVWMHKHMYMPLIVCV